MAGTQDNWSAEAYQHSASFVPKLATKVMKLLDPQPNDVILDIGCGDGILSVDIASVLSQGTGKLVGLDSSNSMIEAARKLAQTKGLSSEQCAFNTVDAANITPASLIIAPGSFTKVFSNAALHWILTPVSTRRKFFDDVHSFLPTGGKFIFECGGRGNIAEVRAAFLSAISRQVGFEKAAAACPWFFPDEEWTASTMGGKWEIEKCELEHRPTVTDAGGVAGWVRLMGKEWFDVIGVEGGEGGGKREEAVKEATKVLEEVCRDPEGQGWRLAYVRLRVVARKL